MAVTIFLSTVFNYAGTLYYGFMRLLVMVYYPGTVNHMCAVHYPGAVVVSHYNILCAAVAGIGITVVCKIGIRSWAVYGHFVTCCNVVAGIAWRQ